MESLMEMKDAGVRSADFALHGFRSRWSLQCDEASCSIRLRGQVAINHGFNSPGDVTGIHAPERYPWMEATWSPDDTYKRFATPEFPLEWISNPHLLRSFTCKSRLSNARVCWQYRSTNFDSDSIPDYEIMFP